MAFNNANLTVGGNPGQNRDEAPKIWTYGTNDAITAVRASGYFNDASAALSVGDFILVRSSISGTAAYSLNVVLTISDAGVVDVSNGLSIPTTNS